MISIEHKRAKFAYDKIKNFFDSFHGDENAKKMMKKEFKSWASKFPTMISTCGLLQAVSFYSDKEKGKEVCNILTEWLKEIRMIELNQNCNTLLSYLLEIDDFKEYLIIQKESLKFLTWVKRFASILEKE